mgnify:FL=1
MAEDNLVLDTNIFMEDCSCLLEDLKDYKLILSSVVLEELDHLKNDEVRGYKARNGLRFIDKNSDKFNFIIHNQITTINGMDERKNDNLILDLAAQMKCSICTNDRAIKIKAKLLGIPYVELQNKNTDIYKGYKEVTMEDIELAWWYESEIKVNKWDLLPNEYLVIKDEAGEICDKQKWTENGFVPVKYKTIENKFTGKIKPRNMQQELLFDMLQDDNSKIKLTTGSFGTGKDFTMLSDALNKIERGKYNKIIWIRNTWGVKNSKDIGFLPGNSMEKLMPYAMVLSDIVGGQYGMEYLLNNQQLELQHLSTIRGRNFNNAILYCTEAENLTKEHIQIILSRLGQNSCLYINGDYKQSDDKLFESNSGINCMIDKLKGNPLFGYVELKKTERSKVANLASLLD